MSGLGDFTYGILSFFVAGQFSLDAVLRFVLGVALAMVIFLSFQVLVHSLSFWLGNSQGLAQQMTNAIITFSIYPITLFDGTAKLLLFTVLPAALVGAVPAEFIRQFSWLRLTQLLAAALVLLTLVWVVFRAGLRRYESGSAIQTQV
jgi:ABC-2 type transport system permease protein